MASVADLEKVHTEYRERLFFLSEHEVGSLLLMKFCARISDLNLEEPNILLFDDHIADLERMKMTLLNGIGSKALMNIVHVCNKDEVFAMLLKRTVHIDIMKESMDVRPLFSSLFRTLNVRLFFGNYVLQSAVRRRSVLNAVQCRELISEILSRRNELETHHSAR
ncbi:hypothetical protein YC2023_082696 [Brassica napus]